MSALSPVSPKLSACRSALFLALFAARSALAGDSVVTFNEIHYHPTAAQPGGEWLELKNQRAVNVDISGWRLDEGVNFTFPAGTVIKAGGYLVIAANPGALQTAAGITGVVGPYTGSLSNSGERVLLRNNDDRVMDEVDYKTDGDWPSAPDGSGATLTKRTDAAPSEHASSWRASRTIGGGTPGSENFASTLPPFTTTLFTANSPWLYRADGADLGTAWRQPGASEAGWTTASGTFQLGSAVLPAPATAGTTLPAGPTTYYFRRTFDYSGQVLYTQLKLRLLVDDGAAVYLNGAELARLNLAANAAATTGASTLRRSAPVWREFLVPGASLLPTGNLLAVEVHQAAAIPASAAAILNSGPLAFWRLNDLTSAAGDVSDLAHVPGAPEQGPQDGTAVGLTAANIAAAGPRPTDTVNGQPLLGFEANNTAPVFQGNNDNGDDVLLFPDAGQLNFSTSNKFSCEAWVKAPTAQESGACIFGKGTGGGGEQFTLDIYQNQFRFYVRDGVNPANYSLYQYSAGPSGVWQHVAITYDTAAGIMRLYINGVDVGGTAPRPTIWNTTSNLSVGARQGSSGPYDLNFNGSIDEVAVFNRALSAAEVQQHFNAAFASSATGTDTTDAVFSAELFAIETLPANAASPVLLNEVSTAGVELINLGASQNLAGFTVLQVNASGVVSHAVPAQTLSGGGFAQINLPLVDGDRVVLVGADGATVLDSFEVKNTPRSRFPDGTGPWLRAAAATPGAANQVELHSDIVINELMFDLPSSSLFPAGTARAGKWVELFNRSAAPVDLSGWEFTEGIGYTFPAGTSLAPGGYLVVAENPSAVVAVHGLPAAQVFGPFTGSLSGTGEDLELSDALGNRADYVRYAGGGRWPEASDGGGSSRELRDAFADHNAAESWAASDESSKGAWQTFTWRGAYTAGQTGEPTLWHELNLLLVDGPGEALIDDIRVTDLTTSANLIQNGDFSAGSAHWRFLGTHRTSVVEGEPGNPANAVLHLKATGPGEYQGNQIESTYLSNQTPVEGRQYEISLRARWLSGGARLNTRMYYNRIAQTNLMGCAANGGTPGAANSRAVANLGPTYTQLAHTPVVPAAGVPVTVSIAAQDPQGVASMTLRYAISGGAWQSAAMTLSSGRYTATIGGQSAGAVVQFYIEGRDGQNALSTFPADGLNSRALYVVDSTTGSTVLPRLRLVMTTADANFMHTPVNVLSNAFLRCTVIDREKEAYYDAGVRLKGSFVGRNVARVGFALRFGPDQLFRGVHDKASVDRSQGAGIGISEIITKHIATAAGGIPGMYDDLAAFIHPLGTYNSTAMIRLAGFDELYLDSQYPSGSDGQMFEVESLRWNLSTIDGNPESPKQPGNEGSGTGYANPDLGDYGNNKESYRWNFLQTNHRDDDDYTRAIALEKMFSLSGTSFAATAIQRIDVNSWLRTLAFQSLVGPNDVIYTGGNNHNFRVYFRPNDGRALYFPWDWDSSWARGTTDTLVGGSNISKVVSSTADLHRRYYAELNALIGKTYNTTYMSAWTTHYTTVSGQDLSGVLSYIGSRASYVLSQLPTAVSFSASPGTVSGNGAVTIAGAANINVEIIEVNGVQYVPTWNSDASWSILVPLAPGQNPLTIRGLNRAGALVAGATASTNVNNPFTSTWPALKINEWLADNDHLFLDPADGESDDWFEIYNPTANAVSIANWRLTDQPGSPTPFVVPAGWSIPAGGRLLVWADDQTVENPASPTATSALHVPFKLSKDGDSLQIAAPDGTIIDLVTFGPQTTNVSEGRKTDGAAAVAPLTLPTPGTPNAFTVVTPLTLGPGGSSFQFTTTPGLRYTLERSGNLTAWVEVEPAQIAISDTLTITDPTPPPPTGRQFYRVRVGQ